MTYPKGKEKGEKWQSKRCHNMPLTSKVSVDLVSLVSFSYGESITYFNGSTAKK